MIFTGNYANPRRAGVLTVAIVRIDRATKGQAFRGGARWRAWCRRSAGGPSAPHDRVGCPGKARRIRRRPVPRRLLVVEPSGVVQADTAHEAQCAGDSGSRREGGEGYATAQRPNRNIYDASNLA